MGRLSENSSSTQRDNPWSKLDRPLRFSLEFLWPEKALRTFLSIALVIGVEAILNITVPKVFGLTPGTSTRTPWIVVAYVLVAFLQENIINRIKRFLWRPLRNNAEKKLSIGCGHHVMRLSMNFQESHNPVNTIASIDRGKSICDFMGDIFVTLIPSILGLASTVAFIVYDFGPYMGLMVAGVMVVFSLVCGNLITEDAIKRKEWHKHDTEEKEHFNSVLTNWLHIFNLDRLKDEEEEHENLVHKKINTAMESTLSSIVSQLVLSLILLVGCAAAIIIIFYQETEDEHLTGNILTLITYWTRFSLLLMK